MYPSLPGAGGGSGAERTELCWGISGLGGGTAVGLAGGAGVEFCEMRCWMANIGPELALACAVTGGLVTAGAAAVDCVP